jgi:nicotinamidase-related amidase
MTTSTAQAHKSKLVFVDIQTKLVPAMHADEMPQLLSNCGILAQAAKILTVPTLYTEQYSKGLGETVPELTQYLAEPKTSANAPIEKLTFSSMGEPRFRHKMIKEHSQIVLVGIEAHICVLQTALSLVDAGKTVFVVEDAICSRSSANKANAVQRMREAGCIITNTESVVFEWLGRAGSDEFKAISQLIR